MVTPDSTTKKAIDQPSEHGNSSASDVCVFVPGY